MDMRTPTLEQSPTSECRLPLKCVLILDIAVESAIDNLSTGSFAFKLMNFGTKMRRSVDMQKTNTRADQRKTVDDGSSVMSTDSGIPIMDTCIHEATAMAMNFDSLKSVLTLRVRYA
mmetsp:Transcript_2958/g.2972  ORF Transcript_2958/g.2972 Transcript_2958/m.2972 type:complete len:117 (-) Transcript_2958:690-1040(-)